MLAMLPFHIVDVAAADPDCRRGEHDHAYLGLIEVLSVSQTT